MLITLLISLIIGGVHAISEEEREVGLRLVGGTKPHEGNVQILFNYTTWKHICDDEWGIRDAKVVCKQLGYAKALKATLLTRYPLVASIDPDESDYNSTYWSTRLQCEGDETNIRNCNNGEVREEECRGVNNFAGVVCTNETTYVQTNPKPSKTIGNVLELRLVGQSEHGFISSGYLEVLHDGVWGAVCADTWAYNEDFVTCGNLGYPSVDPMKEIPSRHNHVVTHYWMRDVKCSGWFSFFYFLVSVQVFHCCLKRCVFVVSSSCFFFLLFTIDLFTYHRIFTFLLVCLKLVSNLDA